MDYFTQLIGMFPICLAATAVIYAAVYIIARRKRGNIGFWQGAAEFVLLGWLVTFVYITQIYNFGNGMGSLYNIKPLHVFAVAFRYGTKNSEMVRQFALNILMFVPLGLLLPVVFPGKLKNWWRVFGISLALTVSTELLQLLSRRGTDIDDVIANTLGGLCGYALYIIICGIICAVKKEEKPAHYGRSLTIGIMMLCLAAMPYIALCFSDSSAQYGNFYYGHLQPTAIEITDSVSDEKTTGNVYKYFDDLSDEGLEKKLITESGFSGSFTDDGSGTRVLADGDNKRIFIYDHHTWCVDYNYGRDAQTQPLADRDTLLSKAWDYLAQYDITDSDVSLSKDESGEYVDGNVHFSFSADTENGEFIACGNVYVALDGQGNVISIQDSRIKGQFEKRVGCISPKNSVSVAKSVGVGEWNGTAYVESVEPGHVFISDTGYIVPSWKINAKFVSAAGEEYDWSPVIDAVG